MEYYMFFQPSISIDELLVPYLTLDKTLFKGSDDGLACRKKFSNNGEGVSLETRGQLNELAKRIRDGKFKPANWLSHVDVFTLFSNHLDQQTSNEKNPKPGLEEKQALVLNFLEAAWTLSPVYDYADLSQHDPRELSSHALLLHYLGKARRYNSEVKVEDRLPLLNNALTIAKHLASLSCPAEVDVHAYQNRIPTFELPVNYCLQDLKRFDEAAALIAPQLKLASPFHVAQARIQLAANRMKKFEHTHDDSCLTEALAHAEASVPAAMASGAALIQFNARVCLMNTQLAAGFKSDARHLAEAMQLEISNNSNCGAKPDHIKAIDAVLEATGLTVAP